MKFPIAIAACAALFSLSAPIALASTPDDRTPAEETICNGLIGMTPGLYGLCVAYCEAQDLDQVPFGEREAPKRSLLKAYERKKTDADPGMPCLQPPPCACYTGDELMNLVRDGEGGACADDDTRVTFMQPSPFIGLLAESGEMASCASRFTDADGVTIDRAHELEQDEADLCKVSLQAACDEAFPGG